MKTLVIGASTNPSRYAYLAIERLVHYGHEVIALGRKEGTVFGIHILTSAPPINDIDTVTLYLNPVNQREWYDYIISMHPRRIIFNPGTENPELRKLAEYAGIFTEYACTLVLLATNVYEQ